MPLTPYASGPGWTAYHGDLRDVAPSLSGADLVLTDPSYEQTSHPWDRWVDGWPSLALNVIQSAGSMWCFGTFRMWWDRRDEFAGWRVAQDVIWEKHNGSGLAADRFRRVHEQPVHFYPKGARWSDVYKLPQRVPHHGPDRTVLRRGSTPHLNRAGQKPYRDNGTRLVRSVLRVRSGHRASFNPTKKPAGIVSPLLRYSCPPGGLVVDLFMGEGSTLIEAQGLGMRAVGVDVREDQCEYAANRLARASVQEELCL